MSALTRVFVYGTLKRGLHNHYILMGSTFIGDAYTVESFRMFGSGFPVIFPQTYDFDHESEDDVFRPVYGEIYDVDSDTLVRLDDLEAEGVMYDRKKINVIIETTPGFPGEPIIDANVTCYIGNPGYWRGHQNPEYTDVNAFGELEWRANV